MVISPGVVLFPAKLNPGECHEAHLQDIMADGSCPTKFVPTSIRSTRVPKKPSVSCRSTAIVAPRRMPREIKYRGTLEVAYGHKWYRAADQRPCHLCIVV